MKNKNPRLDTQGLTKIQIQAASCCLIAFDNHMAADLLLEKPAENLNLVPTGIVLRAFSVELMIKAGLIAQEQKACPKSHDISVLFSKLDEHSRMASAHYFDQRTGKDLVTFLAEQKDAFIDWRYLFEKENLTSHPETLRDAFLSIYQVIGVSYEEIARAVPFP